jgi:hypothetical protein
MRSVAGAEGGDAEGGEQAMKAADVPRGTTSIQPCGCVVTKAVTRDVEGGKPTFERTVACGDHQKGSTFTLEPDEDLPGNVPE